MYFVSSCNVAYWFYTAFANLFSGNTKEFFNILKNFLHSVWYAELKREL